MNRQAEAELEDLKERIWYFSNKAITKPWCDDPEKVKKYNQFVKEDQERIDEIMKDIIVK